MNKERDREQLEVKERFSISDGQKELGNCRQFNCVMQESVFFSQTETHIWKVC